MVEIDEDNRDYGTSVEGGGAAGSSKDHPEDNVSISNINIEKAEVSVICCRRCQAKVQS